MAISLKRLIRYIGSRSFAILTIFVIIVILVVSAFLPNKFTMTENEWERLRVDRPLVYYLASKFSTPEIVSHPLFIGVNLFLFISTSLCTLKRLRHSRRRDFSKRMAFHYSLKGVFQKPAKVFRSFISYFKERGWSIKHEQSKRGIYLIRVHKGGYGFWGSIVFHVSLLILFITAIISAITRFNAEIILTQGIEISLTDSNIYLLKEGSFKVPDIGILIKSLKAEFSGMRPLQVYGEILLDRNNYRFEVNKPVNYMGLQFSPSRYGVAPRFVIEKNKKILLDSYINLRSLFMDDYFLFGDLKIMVRFYPDFYEDNGRYMTKTYKENNPVFHIIIYREETKLKEVFLKKGEGFEISGYVIMIPEYTHWVTMVVSRDTGTPVFIIGFILSMIGLGVRFLSNERFITCLIKENGEFEMRGWSRYYPAFLEREMLNIKDEVEGL